MTTKVLFHIVLPTGEPVANSELVIQLAKSAYGSDGGITLPRPATVTTDADGRAELDLWPSTTLYYLEAHDSTSEASLYYKFLVPQLPAGGVVRLQDIVIDTPVSGTTWDNAALLSIADAKANARASQLAAANSAATAAATATATGQSVLQMTANVAAAQSSATTARASATAAAASAALAAAIASTTADGEPVNPATLTGTPGVGSTLSVSMNTGWLASSYQWYRNGVAIAGQTSTTYLQTTADIGAVITCGVSGLIFQPLGITVPDVVVIQNLYSDTVLTPSTILQGQ